mmetsp:Transcript_8754/g.24240  ORF Transcript_8754/g.24240 Transcript_8754/m.24240 type:complete len:167 (-) Transcript_8754:400-900(-)
MSRTARTNAVRMAPFRGPGVWHDLRHFLGHNCECHKIVLNTSIAVDAGSRLKLMDFYVVAYHLLKSWFYYQLLKSWFYWRLIGLGQRLVWVFFELFRIALNMCSSRSIASSERKICCSSSTVASELASVATNDMQITVHVQMKWPKAGSKCATKDNEWTLPKRTAL